MSLRVSTVEQEGVYQGAKWLKLQVLCDADELEDLFERMTPFYLFPLTGIGDGRRVSEERFLNEYRCWITDLQEGRIPEDQALKRILAAAFTEDCDALWLQEIPRKGYLVKIRKPIVQVQAHWFSYSEIDGLFRPMSMGSGSVFWGFQFSYPQIYQDAKTMEFHAGEKGKLFETVRLWARDRTRATPFVVRERRINSPIRLGKNCFSWIGRHPQLIKQGISVHG